MAEFEGKYQYKIRNNRVYNLKGELAVLISANEPPEFNEYAGFSSNNNPRFDYIPQLPFLINVIIHILDKGTIDTEKLRELTYTSLIDMEVLPFKKDQTIDPDPDREDQNSDPEDDFLTLDFNYDCADYLKICWVPQGKIFRIQSDEYGNDVLEIFNLKEWMVN